MKTGTENMANDELQDNSNTSSSNPPKKRGKGFTIGMTIAAVAIILALIFGVYMFMGSTQTPSRGGALGQLDNKTTEEIQAELNRIVEEGMMNISIASVIPFDSPTSEGEVKIENSPANHYLMQVELALADTGEIIYTSDILEPNYHIQYAKLDKTLAPGTYNCNATFYALDPETEDQVGQAGAQVTIIING